MPKSLESHKIDTEPGLLNAKISAAPTLGENVRDFLLGLLGKGGTLADIGGPQALEVMANPIIGKAAWKMRNVSFDKIKKLFYDRSIPLELKDTKVIGSSGLPATVYHGTTGGFQDFANAYINPNSKYGPGHYFVESPVVASRYADPAYDINRDIPTLERAAKQAGQNVRPVYLDIKSPFNMDAVFTDNNAIKELPGYAEGKTGRDIFFDTLKDWKENNGLTDAEAKDLFQETLKMNGYDGIKSITGRPGNESQSWIAFDKNQVISKFSKGRLLRKAAVAEEPELAETKDYINKAINDKNLLYYASLYERAKKIVNSNEIKPTMHSNRAEGPRGVSLGRVPYSEFSQSKDILFGLDPSKIRSKPTTGGLDYQKTFFSPSQQKEIMQPFFEFEQTTPGTPIKLGDALKKVFYLHNNYPDAAPRDVAVLSDALNKFGINVPIEVLNKAEFDLINPYRAYNYINHYNDAFIQGMGGVKKFLLQTIEDAK